MPRCEHATVALDDLVEALTGHSHLLDAVVAPTFAQELNRLRVASELDDPKVHLTQKSSLGSRTVAIHRNDARFTPIDVRLRAPGRALDCRLRA